MRRDPLRCPAGSTTIDRGSFSQSTARSLNEAMRSEEELERRPSDSQNLSHTDADADARTDSVGTWATGAAATGRPVEGGVAEGAEEGATGATALPTSSSTSAKRKRISPRNPSQGPSQPACTYCETRSDRARPLGRSLVDDDIDRMTSRLRHLVLRASTLTDIFASDPSFHTSTLPPPPRFPRPALPLNPSFRSW